MSKIRCDQCKTVSATNKGYCPECGAIFVPPYTIIGEDGQTRVVAVREDIGQGKERKLLLKKSGGAATAAAETDAETEAAVERTLADLASPTAPVGGAVMVPAGETAFPGFALLMSLVSVMGWVTMLGGPLAAAMVYRESNPYLAVKWALAALFVGLGCLIAGGAGQVLVAIETQLRGLRAAGRGE